jgi:dTDP-4-amino-4,6-dideoxygalactose transaminase
VAAGVEHARHLYPVQVADRDGVLARLRDQGVPAAVHYPRGAHDQPCFAAERERALPVTEQLAGSLLSLPMHPYLGDDAARRIAAALTAALR